MGKSAICVLVTVVVLNLPLAACSGSAPRPSPPGVETPGELTELVSAAEGATITRPEYGFSVVIPAGALSEEAEVSLGQANDPLSGGSSRALGTVYDLDLGQAHLRKPIEVSIRLPEGQGGEIAEAHVVHWTGSHWEYLDTIMRDGWATAKVSSGARFSIGYMTYVVLRGRDRTIERGRLEVRRLDDGTQVVIMYNGRGEVISESTAGKYRDGLLYHLGQLWTIPPLSALISEGHVEVTVFRKALDDLVAQVVGADGDVASKDRASLTLFAPQGWTSGCSADIGDGGREKVLGVEYREGRLAYGPAIRSGPWLFVEVTEAENLVGDYVYLVFYSGQAAILAVKANVHDMLPGTQYQLTLPLMEDQVPVADSQLIALAVGPPDIAWWQSWEDRDSALLCAYGREAASDGSRPANYFVDSLGGSDLNPGTSRDKPWRTLGPVQSHDFLPGEVVLFKRDSSWGDGLVIDDSGVAGNPITFTTYGTGSSPVFSNPGGWQVISINADWVVVEGLLVREAQEAGVGIMGGHGNIIRGIEATDVGIGIAIRGQHNLATHNYVHDLHMVHNDPGGDDDYGAVGIWFFDSNNEASYNRMVNCRASSYDYGSDGGAVEWWGNADDCYAHHNYATGCDGFFEVSVGSARNSVVAYNVSAHNNGRFAWLHLSGHFASEVQNFRLENNTVVEVGGEGWVILGFSGKPDADTLLARNNIFYVDRLVSNELGFTHDHNIYYSSDGHPELTFALARGEMVADPLFVDLSSLDLHLQTGSSAIDAGMTLGYSLDFDGRPVPIGPAPDAGAYEHVE